MVSEVDRLRFGHVRLKDRMALLDHPQPGKGFGMDYDIGFNPVGDREFNDSVAVNTGEWDPDLLDILGFDNSQAETAMSGINLIVDGSDGSISPSSHYRTRA